MPYPAAHSLLTFSGPAFNDQEEWSTGLRLRRTAPPTVAELSECTDAFLLMSGTNVLRATNQALLVSTKWAPQGTDGKYGDGNAVEFLRPPSGIGGGGGNAPQLAVVLSMRTARPRGRGSNGRMYIPAAPSLEGNTGRFPAGEATTIATAAALFVSTINEILQTEAVVGSTVGAGLLETITGVRVGRVLDTQRRRRAGIPELYSEAAPVDF